MSTIVLIAPGEGADEIAAGLAALGGEFELVRAEPVEDGDGPGLLAAALAAYEAQGKALAPAAAIVHGSGDRPLAAAISLAKLEVPLARVARPAESDLIGLVAGHTIAPNGSLAEQVRDWLRTSSGRRAPRTGPAGA